MEDDGGMATTVVMKARSAYTWLDKLRFLKGLLPQDASVDFSCKRLLFFFGIVAFISCDIVVRDGVLVMVRMLLLLLLLWWQW
jgi:hypothetical protein